MIAPKTMNRTFRPAIARPGAKAFLAVGLLAVGLLTLAAPSWAAGAKEGDAEPAWLTDLDAAVETAQETGAYIVVDLYAEWCGWCKKLEREVFPAPAFRQFADDKVLLRVDVEDGADGSALQARYGAYNLPTTLILDGDLVRVGKVSGFAPADALVAQFEAEIAGWQRLVSRFPQILSQGTQSLQRSLADEMHERGDGGRAAQLYARLIDATGSLSPETPWLYFKKADAHRLAGDFEAAAKATSTARQMADQGLAGAADSLAEKLDLLAYQIAQDAGDCQRAKSTLQEYLDMYPQSNKRRVLARQLKALERGAAICA